MMFADVAAEIALAFSGAGLGAYFDAEARWPGQPVTDDGGSIVTPGTPIVLPCSVQVDAVTEAMRGDADYRDRDVRLLVLRSTLGGDLDTDAVVQVLAGPHEGAWSLQSVSGDPMGVYWECRGRRA
ncbi:hypothetical protein GCM10011380_00640 [Sphingomonas metalli]|uniref:Uncharacterized protein n=1 Tax=Sphingomonas metalli TaxID=1779358 RepID=A0A916ST58_9SPHN|nr:hypothetical protein [Sphingomonas metalli]GGB15103.1 hypothetical protein GCM10011380_00640 [Sphingomonas metalli]